MRKLFLFFALATVLAGSASAQLVSVGAIGGVRLTDAFSYNDESRPYVVGGSVEVHLPAQFALEADALYQRIGNSNVLSAIILASTSTYSTQYYSSNRERGNSWEFPLYGKYYFRPHTAAWQPFIGAGFAFRTISFHDDQSYFNVPNAANGNYHFDFRSNLDVGATAVAGIRFHYGPVAFLPQVRYTRWSDNLGGGAHNEATLLLGVTF
jgi:outer membrane protein W